MHVFLWALPLLGLGAATEYTPFDDSELETSSFFEQFLGPDLAQLGWVVSSALKKDGSLYLGKWELQEPYKYAGLGGDKGLVMTTEANFFAISKKLPQLLTSGDRDLVLQFEVKFQEGITCGGAYLKLLSGLDPAAFSDELRYEVMFGPDICGSQNRVHFLVKNNSSENAVDSKLRTPPMAKVDQLSNLYTLIVRANHDMELRINGGVAKAGNLLATANLMVPSLSVPEHIPDPDAQKPADWDERQYIVDPLVQKPADYDQVYNSMWIPDPAVRKPEGWNDDETEPLYIADSEARRPEEWDDEEDGVWKAPLIRNPKCLYGCGKWEAPMVVNLKYKGEWVPPQIENPDYKGKWTPPLVANPDFKNDVDISTRPIDGIGIDVWSMQSGVMFNNIYLGHSVSEAERIGNETFVAKHDLEYENYRRTKPRAKHEPQAPPKTFEDIIDEQPNLFTSVGSSFIAEIDVAKAVWESFQLDPMTTMLKHPIRFACYCFLFVVVFTFTLGAVNVLVFTYVNRGGNTSERGSGKTEEENSSVENELTEEEMIAQITGRATGLKTRATTTTRKVK